MDGGRRFALVVHGCALVFTEVALGHVNDLDGVSVALVCLLNVARVIDGDGVLAPGHGSGRPGVDDAHQLHSVPLAGAHGGLGGSEGGGIVQFRKNIK